MTILGKKGSTNAKSYSKKGGNFLGSVGELVAPTGWESFVTTAGLFALDRADAVFRRGNGKANKADKKSGGGADGSASGGTMRKKYTRKQVGGNIEELSRLIYNNISPFIDGIPARGIVPEWEPYIRIPSSNQPMARMKASLEGTDLLKSLINTKNSDGQTLLYLACKNSNLKLYNLLIGFGANHQIINENGSTILHGIAWGNDNRPGGAPTYKEKMAMLNQIIRTVPELIFNINRNGEIFYDNLMYKHPETIPLDTLRHICSRSR
jgi:hypothetical protein